MPLAAEEVPNMSKRYFSSSGIIGNSFYIPRIGSFLPSFLFLSYESEPEKAIDGAQEAGFRRYPAVRAGKL